ncbi:MAG: CapA family protein, partial [Candidatus Hydrogenedentes bacterium]|nr:CapA family protein [Candidatus Hydrogenedentota bacterium]
MLSATFRECIKALLASGAIALLVIYGMQIRHGLRKKLWVTGTALFLIAVAAVAGYFEFGWKRYNTFMNPHDFYHYYTGTKYAPELGYYNQYAASLLADQEQKKVFDTNKAVRNLQTHGYTPTAEVFKNQDVIKGRFSPERWEDFKKDILYFQEKVPRAKWNRMLRDKGYNGTPVWSMVTGALTNAISTDSEGGMTFLFALDPIILGIMFLAIWWAFGPWAALFAVASFGTNFSAFVHIKGGLLRMDWVVCLIISMCMVHKKHFKTAGVVLAYAAAARVFPAVFAFGLGALACWELLATRKINRDYVRFFASFAITSFLLLGLSYLYYGPALWQEFIVKIGVHNSDISTTRVGFKYIFLWPFASFGAKVEGFKAHQELWWQIQAAMLVITFIAARKMKPWQALGLGFVPALFLTAPTFYYYVYLIVPVMIFLPALHRARNVLGAVLFFAVSIAAYILHFGWDMNFPLTFFLSCMYGALCVYIVGLHLLPEWLLQSAEGPRIRVEDAPVEEVEQFFLPADGETLESPNEEQAAFASATLEEPPHQKSRSIVAPLLGVAYVAFIFGLFFVNRATPKAPTTPASTPQVTTDSPASETPNAATQSVTPPAIKTQPATTPTGDRPTITMALVGDVMMSRNVARDLKSRNLDFTYPFDNTADMLQSADIAFANLECPISGRGDALDKKYLFNAPPESVKGLVFGGFDVVSIANNHILDYGTVALDDTRRILAENKIPGVGITKGDEPQGPFIIERKGIRVGFLAYADHKTPYAYAKEFLPFEIGPAKAKKESIARDIAALKPKVDIVVVSLHWGIEYQDEPNERQIDRGHLVIEQGADGLAGHHPT